MNECGEGLHECVFVQQSGGNDVLRMLKMNSSEWPYLVLGVSFTLVWGCIQPAYSFLFGRFLGVSDLFSDSCMLRCAKCVI